MDELLESDWTWFLRV